MSGGVHTKTLMVEFSFYSNRTDPQDSSDNVVPYIKLLLSLKYTHRRYLKINVIDVQTLNLYSYRYKLSSKL